jgi:hypothetical protein
LARAENVNRTYVGRLLNLTLLAPDLVDAILNGRRSAAAPGLQADGSLPSSWSVQRDAWGWSAERS